MHRKREFAVAGSPVYVARSSLWNYDNEPPGFIEVRVQPDAVAVEYVDLPPPPAR